MKTNFEKSWVCVCRHICGNITFQLYAYINSMKNSDWPAAGSKSITEIPTSARGSM